MKRGEVANPRAPCVVTTIDPDYIKDAGLQRLAKKFRMKTDILLLREITRNKFMCYSTQEMFLDRRREVDHQNQLYREAQEFHKFAADSLMKMKANEFKKMLQAQENLKKLKENKVAEELNQVKLQHQRVLMEVQEIYGRFQYLLKLISYFDDTLEQQSEQVDIKLPMPQHIANMEISERHPAGLEQVRQVKQYMEQVIRPYLDKRNHLNAEIWIKGYERNRMKVSNYNKRFTQLALLNHIVGILHDKAEKTQKRNASAVVFLKDPEFLQRRMAALQQRAHELFNDYEHSYCKDKLSIKLNSIVPVILKRLQNKVQPEQQPQQQKQPPKTPPQKSSKQWRTVEAMRASVANTKKASYKDEQDTTLTKVEKIQTFALELLGKLDAIPPTDLRRLEKSVRRHMAKQNEMSRRALVKQNRLHNWMEHFKKHHRLQQAQYSKQKA
ncbi:GH19710 [Drosophila grimshawi]|uniref:GH19710 n=1 Tax=Drosophila grimshawi TaxID=7222 RepID=B4J4P3_DROGR|nr:GH19710 [Drosophila grimshawi]